MSQIINLPWLRSPAVFRFALACLALTIFATAPARADEQEKSWPDIRNTLFGDRPIEDGSAMLALTAPDRASDAAIVPVEMKDLRPAATANAIKTVTLIVDENPAPVAATFTLSPEAHVSAIETRLRVNSYSYVRVVAETEDGVLHMVRHYVKASGGCSAPASKNPDEALASLGEMRLRHYAVQDGAEGVSELQLQIRHPNYSGLQMDQVTGLYRPAMFVNAIQITADGKPVMSVEGAISLSENPSIRFRYRPNGGKTIAAHVEDTDGHVFDKSWNAAGKPDGKDS